jgi:hypothetical protein
MESLNTNDNPNSRSGTLNMNILKPRYLQLSIMVACLTTNLFIGSIPAWSASTDGLQGKTWTIVTNDSQVYGFRGDYNSSILASPGTMFAITGHHQVTVRKGSVIVIAAGKPVQVVTTLGTYDVPKGGAVLVKQGQFGSVRVADLIGESGTFNVDYRGQHAQVTVAQNNQTTLVESQVATAGSSDYVPAVDAKAGPVNGLMQDQKSVQDRDSYVSQLRGVDVSMLPLGMRTSLHNLIMRMSD